MKEIRSDIAWSSTDQIVVRGKSLPDDILGKMNIGDFSYFQLTGRVPTPQQSQVFNAIIVTLAEHGITLSSLVARMTYAGAPESMQAAVAAGLCGLGSVAVGTMEGSARFLSDALPSGDSDDVDLDRLAQDIVARFRAQRASIPGLGHLIHKPIDPRTPRLFAIAEENGLSGRYVELMKRVQIEAERVTGKSLPINATGAIGAICCELGFSWKICRGFGVMARAIGLVGHILEEIERPISGEIWRRIEEEAASHLRPTAGTS